MRPPESATGTKPPSPASSWERLYRYCNFYRLKKPVELQLYRRMQNTKLINLIGSAA